MTFGLKTTPLAQNEKKWILIYGGGTASVEKENFQAKYWKDV